jgi:hypothetical protein
MSPAEVLEQVEKVARSLRSEGEAFNENIVPSEENVMDAMSADIDRDDGVPFEVCIALTTSWLVYNGQATHADKVLAIIRGKDLSAIDELKHPRGHAVRLALNAWMPLTNTWVDNYCPTPDELHEYYAKNIHNDASWCRWAVLAAVKLYAILHDWDRKEINRFIPPIGRPVRAALKHFFGMEIADPETTSTHHVAYKMQLRLARLASTSVGVINSGLWRLGTALLEEDGDAA